MCSIALFIGHPVSLLREIYALNRLLSNIMNIQRVYIPVTFNLPFQGHSWSAGLSTLILASNMYVWLLSETWMTWVEVVLSRWLEVKSLSVNGLPILNFSCWCSVVTYAQNYSLLVYKWNMADLRITFGLSRSNPLVYLDALNITSYL